jgi:hypothetical protein
MDEVRKGRGRNMRIFYCGEILKRMGMPAHRALIEAAKDAKSPEGRFQCAFFLQDLFNDYQCFDVCIIALSDSKVFPFRRTDMMNDLRDQLCHRFPDVPGILLCSDAQGELTGELTSEFRDWLKVHCQPKGTLPKVNLPQT